MAALLVSSVLEAVRKDLHDHGATPRWDNPTLIGLATQARRAIVGLRPDALYVGGEIITDLPADLDTTVDPATLDLEIDPQFLVAAMAYICMRLMFQQQENAANVALANGYMGLFSAELK